MRVAGTPRGRFLVLVAVLALGSLASLFLALGLGIREVGFAEASQWLAGVCLSSLFSALLSLILIVHGEGLTNVFYWIMGGMAGRGWRHVALVAPYLAVGLAVLAAHLHRLNVLQLGEGPAAHLGIAVE